MVWSRLVYGIIEVKFLHDTHPYIHLYSSLFKHDWGHCELFNWFGEMLLISVVTIADIPFMDAF